MFTMEITNTVLIFNTGKCIWYKLPLWLKWTVAEFKDCPSVGFLWFFTSSLCISSNMSLKSRVHPSLIIWFVYYNIKQIAENRHIATAKDSHVQHPRTAEVEEEPWQQ